MAGITQRATSLVTGRRGRVPILVTALLLTGVTVGAVGEAERSPRSTDTLPAGYESTAAAELQERLPTPDASPAVVLFTVEDEAVDLRGELVALERVVAGAVPEVDGPPVRVVPADDGTAALAVVVVPARTATETSVAVTALRERLRAEVPDGVAVQVTGPAAVLADLAAVFDGADTTLLLATASVVAVLLLVTYRSPVLWVVPLAVVAVADRTAVVLATHVLAAVDVPWDESTLGILSVLVFGAGTNYALLLISRYRDELRTHEDRFTAMRTALRRAADAVFASASTVVVGVLTLLLSVVPTTRGLGLATAVGIVVAASAVLLLLPPALLLFGRWVFWPVVPRLGQPTLAERRSVWRRIGDRVAARPGLFVLGAALVLGSMALGLTQVRLGLPADEQFRERPEAVEAAERLAESFPSGAVDPAVVVVATEDADRIDELLAAAEGVPTVGSVAVSAQGGGVTQLDVVLTPEPGTEEARQAVRELREALAPSDALVTGGAAREVDLRLAASRDRAVVMPLVLTLVAVALMLLLRSVLAPVVLVGTVAMSFLAATGVAWWLFTGVLGFSGLDPTVPLLSFLFLVALGIDYNIFLITRTVEEARTVGTRTGVLRALGATGGVITSAGILLASVFAVLGVLPLVVLAQIGAVICIGVLLDTLVVRTVVVPSIVLTLGERFWWPRTSAPVRRRPGPSGRGVAQDPQPVALAE